MVMNPRCDVWKYFHNIVEEGVAVCKLCNQRLKNQRSFSLRKHITKLHNPESVVWKYFNNIVDEGVAVCTICDKRVRNNRHFNFVLHLKQHDIFVDENENGCKSPSNLKTISKRPYRGKENLCILMDELTLVNAVMGLMVDEGVNPQLFGSKNLQALLTPVCEAISKEKDIKLSVNGLKSEEVVNSVAGYIRDEFSHDIHWRLLSLKLDMDLDSGSNTFYLSAQFVNEIQVESCLLGAINLENGQQLTEKCIVDILNKYNIATNQIVSVNWDNSKAKCKNFVKNSEYLREIQQFEKYTDINVGEVKVERYIGVIAHLCVLEVIKNPVIFHLLKQCRNLTQLILKNLNTFKEKFTQHSVNIPQIDSPWMWGSTYTMMNDLKDALCVIENVNYKQPECAEDQFDLNDSLKNFIDAFCKAFRYIHKAGEKFYTSEMNFGDFYAQWIKCKLLTEKLYNTSEEGSILAQISAELVKSIQNKSVELLTQDHFNACLYLDPRFQHTLNTPEKMFALEYLKQLWNRSKLYNKDLVDPVPEYSVEKNLPKHKFADDEDSFLNEFLCQSVQDADTEGIYKKLEDLKLLFQTADTNVLIYWKELKFCEPQIHTLSSICFAIPATQNYNKINSTHKKNSKCSSNISPNLKQNIDLIRLNPNLLEKAINKLRLFREDTPEVETSTQPSLRTSVSNTPDVTKDDAIPSTSGLKAL